MKTDQTKPLQTELRSSLKEIESALSKLVPEYFELSKQNRSFLSEIESLRAQVKQLRMSNKELERTLAKREQYLDYYLRSRAHRVCNLLVDAVRKRSLKGIFKLPVRIARILVNGELDT
jgi:predicted nuclease with TOPRIM domain